MSEWMTAKRELLAAADAMERAARAIAKSAAEAPRVADFQGWSGEAPQRMGQPEVFQHLTKFAERVATESQGWRQTADGMEEAA